MRVAPDCAHIVDEGDQPLMISTRAEFDTLGKLMARFKPARRESFASRNASPQMKANLVYLRRQYGGPPDRETRFEEVFGGRTLVFSRQVLMFRAYLSTSGDANKLIFVTPLSE